MQPRLQETMNKAIIRMSSFPC